MAGSTPAESSPVIEPETPISTEDSLDNIGYTYDGITEIDCEPIDFSDLGKKLETEEELAPVIKSIIEPEPEPEEPKDLYVDAPVVITPEEIPEPTEETKVPAAVATILDATPVAAPKELELSADIVKLQSGAMQFKLKAMEVAQDFIVHDASHSEVKDLKAMVDIVATIEKSYEAPPEAPKVTVQVQIQSLMAGYADDC